MLLGALELLVISRTPALVAPASSCSFTANKRAQLSHGVGEYMRKSHFPEAFPDQPYPSLTDNCFSEAHSLLRS